MKVKHAMSRRVMFVRPEDPLEVARVRMGWAGVRHIPVVDAHKGLVGLVGGRDLLPFLFHEDALVRTRCSDVMHTPVATAAPNEEIQSAAGRMARRGIGCLPVLDGDAIVGIMTVADVLGAGKTRLRVRADPGATVGSVMTPFPVALKETDDFLDAIALLLEAGVRHIPVLDADGCVVGMISDRDVRTLVGDPLAAWVSGAGTPWGRCRVSQVMNTTPVTIEAWATIADAAARFADEKVDALAVVDREDRLVGMLSWLDILARMRPPDGRPRTRRGERRLHAHRSPR